jgi:hypothetical protein
MPEVKQNFLSQFNLYSPRKNPRTKEQIYEQIPIINTYDARILGEMRHWTRCSYIVLKANSGSQLPRLFCQYDRPNELRGTR